MESSLYIHVPFCRSKCFYCDFFSVPLRDKKFLLDKNIIDNFIFALDKELLFRKQNHTITSINTIYIGGGTPSLLPSNSISTISAKINNQFINMQSTVREFTIEMNPEDVSQEKLNAYKNTAINRISIGIQSFQDEILESIGRKADRDANICALKKLSLCWQGKLSIDLISGLPGHTKQKLKDDIYTAISFKPDHVSLYALTIEKKSPLAKMISKGNILSMPTVDESDELWLYGRDLLEKKGYVQYEISNFSTFQNFSLHNMCYWNLDSYIGLGPGATGTIINGDEAFRYTNTIDINAWIKNPCTSFNFENITRMDLIKETIMMNFRMTKGLNRNKFISRFNNDILELIPNTLKKWQKKKLLYINTHRISLTRQGLVLLHQFLVDCFEELTKISY